MKKIPKLKKTKLRLQGVKRPFRRAKAPEQRVSEALSNVPRITNDTVAEHREEVLGSARKYIYPLQHSKHRVVRTSIVLLVLVIVSFFVYCGLALYKFQSTSAFIYDVSRVIPFPVAKAGKNWVSYESYLFELRRNMHYYRTQQQTNFASRDGKTQLARLKKQALAQVTDDAYVKQLAAINDVSVNQNAVDDQVLLVRNENRLGNSDRVFKEVLNEFWGWDENDFKRELKQQLLQQAVAAKLDTTAEARASAAYAQLESGMDFATLAQQVSDDPATKAAGGRYPSPIAANDRNIDPIITNAIFRLKPGQTSPIVHASYTVEILKLIDAKGDSRNVAHIQFSYKDISTHIAPLKTKNPPRDYINV